MAGCECPKWCRLSEIRVAPSGILLGRENPEHDKGYQFIVMLPTDYALRLNRNLPSIVYAKHLNGWYLGAGDTALFDSDCRSMPSYKVNAQIFFCPWCGSKLTEEAGTKDHFAGKVQDTLNEMAEEIPTEEAGDAG